MTAAVSISSLQPARPPEARLSMPVQPLVGRRPKVRLARPSAYWRKTLVGVGAVALAIFAAREMYEVVAPAGVTSLEWVILGVFWINFTWISFAFVTATAGFLGIMSRRADRAGAMRPVASRNVIVFPVYNETINRVFPTIEATLSSLAIAAPGRFEGFILSDTTDPNIALEEEAAFLAIRSRLPEGVAIFYRRRTINKSRKSGNIHDFCERWGGRYDHMIVFDADSVMETETILLLAGRMEADPEAGLIQTLPRLVGGQTIFARAQQFANGLYGPLLGEGVAWWAQREGNYWGHNAIVRVRAFAEAAGLPTLPGEAPLGGPILSHDFVEAALLRRAGWSVRIDTDIEGSYEDSPPSIIDLMTRDRRWCQGNLQHAGFLLRGRGFLWTSRLHLMIGVMGYLASPMWMVLILVGMALSLQARFLRPEYFTSEFQLFPDWPVIDDARALALFGVTMAILLIPKVYGLVWGLTKESWRRTVGPFRMITGLLAETIISALVAPILMVAQTGFVLSILSGGDAGWKPQKREGDQYSFGDVMRQHIVHMASGAVLLGAALAISPVFAAWLSPAAVSLLLAGPISYWTGSTSAGRKFRKSGLLLIPEEINVPNVVSRLESLRSSFTAPTPPASVGMFLSDVPNRAYHAEIVDPVWPLPDGDIYPPAAMAAARLETGSTFNDAWARMQRDEKMALLNRPDLIERGIARFAKMQESPAAEYCLDPVREQRQPIAETAHKKSAAE